MSSPSELGFRMPAEWARHVCCWMAWPCDPITFPDLEAARGAYAAVARTIARFEPLSMVANPEHAADAAQRCGEAVTVVPVPIDDSWTRDTGPTWLVDGRGGLAGVDWPYNCYGELADAYQNDAALAARMLERSGARRFEAPIILEGGAIHTDGEGTLLTTDSVVLNPNRNPGLTRSEAEEVFRSFLGVHRVIWLENAIEVDSTDGHVDNLACFVRPGVVAVLAEQDPEDTHYAALAENQRRLRAATDACGRSLEVVEFHQPRRREFRGNRIGMSYINHYIANGGVVFPVFDDPADQAALALAKRAYPDREIAPVPGLEIVKSEGCVHCITQQQPLP